MMRPSSLWPLGHSSQSTIPPPTPSCKSWLPQNAVVRLQFISWEAVADSSPSPERGIWSFGTLFLKRVSNPLLLRPLFSHAIVKYCGTSVLESPSVKSSLTPRRTNWLCSSRAGIPTRITRKLAYFFSDLVRRSRSAPV